MRNRTTEELTNNTPLSNVRDNEDAFFKKRFPELPADRRGIGALVAAMTAVQLNLIEKSLPDLKKQVGQHLLHGVANLHLH